MRWVAGLLVLSLGGCSALVTYKDKQPGDTSTEDPAMDTDVGDLADPDAVDTTLDGDAPVDPATEEVVCAAPAVTLSDSTLSTRFASNQPDIVWNGSEYAVAYVGRAGTISQIHFLRVSSVGAPLMSDLQVSSTTELATYPDLTWTGSEYGVAWQDMRHSMDHEIYFGIVSATGSLRVADTRITFVTDWSMSPSLAWNGSEYAVTWHDDRDTEGQPQIYMAWLSSEGIKTGSDLRITLGSGSSLYPSLTWTGSEYGLAWQDDRDGNREVYFVRMSADGTKLVTDRRITDDPDDKEHVSLVWTGSEFGVCWHDDRDGNDEIYFARIDAAGAKVGSDVRVTSFTGSSIDCDISWSGTHYGVVWEDDRTGNWQVYYGQVTGDGVVTASDILVPGTSGPSTSGTTVWGSGRFGVAWRDDTTSDSIVMGLVDPCP